MLIPTDLLHLPYTPDLTEAGIAYACRSLAATGGSKGDSNGDHSRNVVSRVVVDLALRRHLAEQKVPFSVLEVEPFIHPRHYDISLGGHHCEMMSCLLSHRSQVLRVHKDPSLLFQASALVPMDRSAAEGHRRGDVYLFAFLLGLTAISQADVSKALAAGQPAHLVHILPSDWARPVSWSPLPDLAVKSECDAPIMVNLGGLDASRCYTTTSVELPPRKRASVQNPFFSLAYIHATHRPEARIGLHSPRCGSAHIIKPHEWRNLWVYGMEIIIAGWLTYEEFRQKASVLKAGMPTFQFNATRLKNLSVPLSELKPPSALLENV